MRDTYRQKARIKITRIRIYEHLYSQTPTHYD